MSEEKVDDSDTPKQGPIGCADIEAYLGDSEAAIALDRWQDIDAHLRDCAACAERLRNGGDLGALLQRHARLQEPPVGLWSEIVERVAADAGGRFATSGRTPARRRWPLLSGLVAAAVILVAVVLAPAWLWPGTASPPSVVTETANDFITFRLSGRVPDVEGSDFRRLAGWLAPRVDFALPWALQVPSGFRLTGGRLCSFLGRRLVSYLFAKGDTAASLYIMSSDRPGALTGPWQEVAADIYNFHSQGLSALVWERGGLLYALVAELSEAELLDFHRAMLGAAEAKGSERLTVIHRSQVQRLRQPSQPNTS